MIDRVDLQTLLGFQIQTTHRTHVRRTAMGLHVVFQSCYIWKRFRAIFTTEWFLPSVYSCVQQKVIFCGKCFSTNEARVIASLGVRHCAGKDPCAM